MYLFSHADILTRAETGYELLRDAYLAVDGSTISYIGTKRPEGAYTEKDLSHRLLLPGLVNGHTHAAMTLLRGVGSGLDLQTWLFDTVFPIEDRLTPEDILAGTELAMLEMIASGTTSFTDMYMEPLFTAPAIAASGMKANITRPLQSFDEGEDPYSAFRLKEMLELYDACHGMAGGRIRVDFSLHAEYTCTERMAEACAKEAHDRGAAVHIHLSETKKEQAECVARRGMTPSAWFERKGVFDNPTYAAHCVWVTPEDRHILQRKGVIPVHCPSSNLKLGSGFAPLRRMLDEKLWPALGTDGAASNNNLNMFEEMHLASLIHNGVSHDPTRIQPHEVLDMATMNGAILQRRFDTGILREGYRADFIAVDLDRPHLMPAADPVSALLYTAQGSDVVLTVCDGNILYENGEYKTLDKERICADVRAAYRRLFNKEM